MAEIRAGVPAATEGEAAGAAGRLGTAGRPDGRACVPAPRTHDITGPGGAGAFATFRVEQRSKGAVVIASGEIDIYTAPALCEAMVSAARDAERVVVDMTGVTFLDSSGLAALTDALGSGDRGPGVSPCLAGPTPTVRMVLDITRFGDILPIHETVAEALDNAG